VLHEKLLYSFHVHHVQALQSPVGLLATAACPTFLSQVLLMDEACFIRNGIFNTCNQCTWANGNPHSFKETLFQQQFAVNVWVGIIGSLLLGHYKLPGASFLQFLSEQLQLLDDVPLAMWLLHGGAPAHSSCNVMQY
jgi:hypothetical protein